MANIYVTNTCFDKQAETLTHSAKSGLICHGEADASFVPTFLHIPLDEP